jgi:predicted ATPase
LEEFALQQPELIGRETELSKLKQALAYAITGKGSTIFIAGEAGIGKTRLVSELITEAEKKGAQVIRGWCLAESLEPLMPVKTALREAGLLHLISGDPPPLVASAYLINDAGMLIAKAEREQLELDSDIFAGMLQAVGNFVQDSLEMMDQESGACLNSLGYGDYTILIRTAGKLSLATVIKGEKSEFLIEDMKAALAHFGSTFDDWSGNMADTEPARSKINWFVHSGKYDGKFLVDDPKLKQENLFDNVLLGLQRASAEKPLLIFLDDLQWADPTTLNLLHYLARNTRKDRVLMLGTYRPEDITQGYDGKPHQLETAMQNMSREDLLEKVELSRLGRDSTESLINGILGVAKFEPGFYDKIHKESDGTPFFVLEVVKLLVEEHAIAKDEAGAWRLMKELDKLDLPIKVYDVVKRRLDRLMKEQRKILDCASVVGEEFQSDIIG